MCDYSLCGIPNRLARDGESLVVHRFFTHSIGLASPLDTNHAQAAFSSSRAGLWERIKSWLNSSPDSQIPAVCIPPGARLLLKEIPQHLQKELGVSHQEEVTFIQMSLEAYTHRDGVRFDNGKQISLQRLEENEPVEVLSLKSAAEREQEQEQERMRV